MHFKENSHICKPVVRKTHFTCFKVLSSGTYLIYNYRFHSVTYEKHSAHNHGWDVQSTTVDLTVFNVFCLCHDLEEGLLYSVLAWSLEQRSTPTCSLDSEMTRNLQANHELHLRKNIGVGPKRLFFLNPQVIRSTLVCSRCL